MTGGSLWWHFLYRPRLHEGSREVAGRLRYGHTYAKRKPQKSYNRYVMERFWNSLAPQPTHVPGEYALEIRYYLGASRPLTIRKRRKRWSTMTKKRWLEEDA